MRMKSALSALSSRNLSRSPDGGGGHHPTVKFSCALQLRYMKTMWTERSTSLVKMLHPAKQRGEGLYLEMKTPDTKVPLMVHTKPTVPERQTQIKDGEGWHFMSGETVNFGYTLESQMKWNEVSKHCSLGKRQSPIHIDSELALPLAFPALETVGFHNLIPSPLQEQPSRVLKQILKELMMVRTVGSSAYLSSSLPLSQLVPKSTDIFYSYHGSLTTPPCSESVIWIVFPDPLPISYSQIAMFRHLSAGDERLVDNFRHVQKLGTRKVYVRRHATEYSHSLATQWNLTSHTLWDKDKQLHQL